MKRSAIVGAATIVIKIHHTLIGASASAVATSWAAAAGGTGSRFAPWLNIQSEALQGVAVHLGPVESVHLKEIRGTLEASGSSPLWPTMSH